MDKSIIGTLLDSYSTFGQFEPQAYYTVCFGSLPSRVRIDLSAEKSKERIEPVLQSIDLQKFGFGIVYKNWVTDESKKLKSPEDYAYEYLFRSDSERMLLHLASHGNSLDIEIYYDVANPASEAWALETSRALREKFRDPKTPKFKVLINQDNGFNTEDVETGDFKSINIQELYNDDFMEIDAIIRDSMHKTESGMILLHGEPGTGKTTYIKHLISKYQDKQFIFIQNDFVKDLLKPIFISFLLQNKNAILIIEDAEKVVIARDNTSDDSVVSTILQLSDGLFSDFLNIKIICTFNTNIERIDKALLRKGRMIAKYRFSPLTPEKTAALAQKLGYENISGSLTLADIFGYEHRAFSGATKKGIGFAQG
ncbi:MAG TPA: AAA family ATPase [Anaerolineales bacterium]|nr:AAA family ATPase [Anaerolineales bacterium]